MERTGFEKVFCFLFGIFVFCVINGKRLEIFMLAALRFYEFFALLGGSAFFFIVDIFCIVSFNFGIDLIFFKSGIMLWFAANGQKELGRLTKADWQRF